MTALDAHISDIEGILFDCSQPITDRINTAKSLKGRFEEIEDALEREDRKEQQGERNHARHLREIQQS